MKQLLYSLSFSILFVCLACQPKGKGQATSTLRDSLEEVPEGLIRYAQGFQLKRASDSLILLDIQDPTGESSMSYHFALIPRGSAAQAELPKGYTPLEIPLERVVCMTSLQLSSFIALGAYDQVVGITSSRHLFDPEMNRRVSEGLVRRIGIEGDFDNEVVMAMNPDLILISPFKKGGYESIKELGIPLLPHLGYKEINPLGQTEWIKLIGILIGQQEQAIAKFNSIEAAYNQLKQLTKEVSKRPTVFSGEIRGGNWYAVGGRSFLAELFRDAGADYFLKDNEASGGVTLDFETVYSLAADIDYWRIVNSYQGHFSYEALAASNNHYIDFKAFQKKQVIYCNLKKTPFYESMPMEPEKVLADLIAIFHPGLLPEHEPSYYHLLR